MVENRDARQVMAQHDGCSTLHYVDPPYLPETRSPANKYDLKHRMYRHELTRADHAELLDFLRGLKGAVILSGYDSPLYASALRGWDRVDKATFADGARPRVESLWLNPSASARADQADLFA